MSRKAVLSLSVIICLMFLTTSGSALDINSSQDLNYYTGGEHQFQVNTQGEITAFNNVFMQNNRIKGLENPVDQQDAVNLDELETQTDDAEEAATQTLAEVLDEGDTADQNIIMDNNNLVNPGLVDGVNVANPGNAISINNNQYRIASGAIDSNELATDAVTVDELSSDRLSSIASSGEVQSNDIGSGEVGSTEIGTGEVTDSEINSGRLSSIAQSGEVQSGDIGSGEVGTSELATSSVDNGILDNDADFNMNSLDIDTTLDVAGGSDGTEGTGFSVNTDGDVMFGGSLIFPGDIEVADAQEIEGDIIPESDAMFALGDSNLRWSELNVQDIEATGQISVGGQLDMETSRITDLQDPENDLDAVNLQTLESEVDDAEDGATQDLGEVLDEGNVANQDIDMNGNSINDADQVGVNTANPDADLDVEGTAEISNEGSEISMEEDGDVVITLG